MDIGLLHKLGTEDQDVHFISFECGSLRQVNFDNILLMKLDDVIDPQSIPVFVVEYRWSHTYSTTIITDGEYYRLAHSTGGNYYMLNVIGRIVPSKLQVHKFIEDQLK